MEPINHPWKERNMSFQTSMIMFHVNLQGCRISESVICLLNFSPRAFPCEIIECRDKKKTVQTLTRANLQIEIKEIWWATLMCWNSTSKTNTLKIKNPEVQLDWGDFTYLNIFVVVMTSHRVGRILPRFLGGGFKHFLFSPLFVEDFQFDQYFSDGLKPPTSFVASWGFVSPYPRLGNHSIMGFFFAYPSNAPPSGKQDINQDVWISILSWRYSIPGGRGPPFMLQQCRCCWEYPPRINISKKGPCQNEKKTSKQHFCRGYASFRGTKSFNKFESSSLQKKHVQLLTLQDLRIFCSVDILFIHGKFPWFCCIPASEVSIEPLHRLYINLHTYIMIIYIYIHISSIASDNKPKKETTSIPPLFNSTPNKKHHRVYTRRVTFFSEWASPGFNPQCLQELKEVWEFWLKDSDSFTVGNGGNSPFWDDAQRLMFFLQGFGDTRNNLLLMVQKNPEKKSPVDTVEVGRWNPCLTIWFRTASVVQDFSHQQYDNLNNSWLIGLICQGVLRLDPFWWNQDLMQFYGSFFEWFCKYSFWTNADLWAHFI